MNKLVTSEFKKFRDYLYGRQSALRFQIDNDPIKKVLDCRKRFSDYLDNVTGTDLAHSTYRFLAKNMKAVEELGKELKQAEEQAKSWNTTKLTDELLEVESAIAEWENIMFLHKVK